MRYVFKIIKENNANLYFYTQLNYETRVKIELFSYMQDLKNYISSIHFLKKLLKDKFLKNKNKILMLLQNKKGKCGSHITEDSEVKRIPSMLGK